MEQRRRSKKNHRRRETRNEFTNKTINKIEREDTSENRERSNYEKITLQRDLNFIKIVNPTDLHLDHRERRKIRAREKGKTLHNHFHNLINLVPSRPNNGEHNGSPRARN